MPWTPAQIPDLSGRLAIVTGANSGIGFHTARHLAEKGAEVILACRNMAKAEDALERIRQGHASARVQHQRSTSPSWRAWRPSPNGPWLHSPESTC